MKWFLAFLSIYGILSCSSSRQFGKSNNSLIYVLPRMVEIKLQEKLSAYNSKEFYFELRQYNDEYSITSVPILNKKQSAVGFLNIENSNRLLLIDTTLYPLVFETDLSFGTLLDSVSPKSLSQRIQKYNSTGYSILRGPYLINEKSFTIRFNKSGVVSY